MNILLTGATSFIGNDFLYELLKNNHKVIVLLHEVSKKNKLLPICDNLIKIYSIDSLNNDFLSKNNIKKLDACFHFAWGIGNANERINNRKNEQIQKNSFEFSKKLLDKTIDLSIDKFVFAGSQGEDDPKSFYGIYKKKFCDYAMNAVNIANTDTKFNIKKDCKIKANNFYNKNSNSNSNKNVNSTSNNNIKYIHLRIYSIFGEKDHKDTLINYCIDSFMNKKTPHLGLCNHKWNYLYVKDLSKILNCILITNIPTGIYDIASKTSLKLRKYVNIIAKSFSLSEKEISNIFGLNKNANNEIDLKPNIKKLYTYINEKDIVETSFADAIKKIITYKQKHNECRICSNNDTETVFYLKNSPNRAQYFSSNDSSKDKVDLELKYCKNCSLYYLTNKNVEYYQEVIRSSKVSTTMYNLRLEEYKKLIKIKTAYDFCEKRIIEKNKFNVLELGCGAGEFLNVIKENDESKSFKLFGFEKNKDLYKMALKNGINVLNIASDEKNFVKKNKISNSFDFALSFNFLEHQKNPYDYLKNFYDCLKEDGLGLITVPSVEYIMQNAAYYELIVDHLFYYSKTSLKYILEKVGFNIVSMNIVNSDTLEFIVSKSKKYDFVDLCCDLKEISYTDFSNKLYQSYFKTNNSVNNFIDLLKAKNQNFALWGASHQGITLLSTTNLNKNCAFVIDSAKFKQNKKAIGTNISIYSPEILNQKKVDNILIVAPGYIKEIAQIIQKNNKNIKIWFINKDYIELFENKL